MKDFFCTPLDFASAATLAAGLARDRVVRALEGGAIVSSSRSAEEFLNRRVIFGCRVPPMCLAPKGCPADFGLRFGPNPCPLFFSLKEIPAASAPKNKINHRARFRGAGTTHSIVWNPNSRIRRVRAGSFGGFDGGRVGQGTGKVEWLTRNDYGGGRPRARGRGIREGKSA